MAKFVVLLSFFTAGAYARRAVQGVKRQESNFSPWKAIVSGLVVGHGGRSLDPRGSRTTPSVKGGDMDRHGGLRLPDWSQRRGSRLGVAMGEPEPDYIDVEYAETADTLEIQGKGWVMIRDSEASTPRDPVAGDEVSTPRDPFAGDEVSTPRDPFADSEASTPRDPFASKEETKKNTPNEYYLNVGKAVDTLNHDIPGILRFDSRINWDIYTLDIETVLEATDPEVAQLLEAVKSLSSSTQGVLGDLGLLKVEGGSVKIFGLIDHLRFVNELRTFCRDFVESDEVLMKTRSDGLSRDPRTGEDCIEIRWSAKLVMKNLGVPEWLESAASSLFGGNPVAQTPQSERTINIDAVSRFFLDGEGKIYRHSIDNLDVIFPPAFDALGGFPGGFPGGFANPLGGFAPA